MSLSEIRQPTDSEFALAFSHACAGCLAVFPTHSMMHWDDQVILGDRDGKPVCLTVIFMVPMKDGATVLDAPIYWGAFTEAEIDAWQVQKPEDITNEGRLMPYNEPARELSARREVN